MDLPAHNRLSQTVPDMMHTLMDTVDKLFEVITGKNVDDSKAQTAESKIGRFKDGVQVQTSKSQRGESSSQAASIITIPVYRISLANRRATSVLSPTEFSPGCIFTKTSSSKSHDWKEVNGSIVYSYSCMHITLLYEHVACLLWNIEVLSSGDVGRQRETPFFFLDTLSLACSEGVSATLADNVEERLHESIALIERDFPMCVQVIAIICSEGASTCMCLLVYCWI